MDIGHIISMVKIVKAKIFPPPSRHDNQFENGFSITFKNFITTSVPHKLPKVLLSIFSKNDGVLSKLTAWSTCSKVGKLLSWYLMRGVFNLSFLANNERKWTFQVNKAILFEWNVLTFVTIRGHWKRSSRKLNTEGRWLSISSGHLGVLYQERNVKAWLPKLS